MKKPKKKWLILIGVIIVLLITGLAVKNFFFSVRNTQVTTARPQTAVLHKGALINSISTSGTIYSGTVENVCSSVSCPVEEIYVNVGDKVKKGQVMATLDMESAYTEFDKAQSTLNSGKRDLDAKTSEYEMNKLLYEDGGISDQDLKASENAVENAKEAYANAQTNYNTLKKEFSQGSITSPIDGTVTESTAEIGLKPSTTGALFVVQDLSDLYVTATVKEFNFASIKTGQDVLVQTNVTDSNNYKGKLTFISLVATSDSSASNVQFEINVKISDLDPLMKVGMNAFLEIILQSKDDVYSVPFDAVVTGQNEQNSIYVIKNNTVEQIPVKTGIESATNIEITGDGLAEGLTVVTNPSSVSAGQTINNGNNNTWENRTIPSGSTPSSGQRTVPGTDSTAGSRENGSGPQSTHNGTQSQQSPDRTSGK